MSRAEAIYRFGRIDGDRFYRRFHTLKVKAHRIGVPFYWSSFDEFWDDFNKVAPPEFHPKTHRFRFNLSLGKGYCPESLTIRVLYLGKNGNLNPKFASELLDQALKKPDLETSNQLVGRILDKVRRKARRESASDGMKVDQDLGHSEQALGSTIDVVFNILEVLESETDFSELVMGG